MNKLYKSFQVLGQCPDDYNCPIHMHMLSTLILLTAINCTIITLISQISFKSD